MVAAGAALSELATRQITHIVGSRDLVDRHTLSKYLFSSVAAIKLLNVNSTSLSTAHLALVAAGVESGILGDRGVDMLTLEVEQVRAWDSRACLQGTSHILMVATEVLSRSTSSLQTRNW